MNYSKFNFLSTLTPVQLLLLFYSVAVILSSIVLALPISQRAGADLEVIDIVFTAVSAISVTGLSTISIAESLSTFGLCMLLLMMQLGAVGIMAIGTLIWMILGKRIGLRERQLIMADQNHSHFNGGVQFIKEIVFLLLIIELFGFLILGTYFLNYYSSVKEAYFQGLFATISAISNGGFAITGNSLIPFRDDYFVQIIIMILIIMGAIGFPVWREIKQYCSFKLKRNQSSRFRFSLFTKVTTITFFLLIGLGSLGIYLLDMNHFFEGRSWHESLFYSLFQSVTTRSGGVSTMDISQLTEENLLFMAALMFIGASPNSAGGGIRTTTFALVIIFIITFARGGKSIQIFNREVYDEDLIKAVTVSIVAFLMLFGATLMISIIEPYSLLAIIFEVMSAFGTVGLSIGITEELSNFSKIVLMALMFIGRVGVITFLFIFTRRKKETNIHYPKERMIIG
jgi:Trk-type K+ transport system membrane component